MKYLLLIIIAASLTSCSVLHKTTTRTHKTTDTTIVHYADSASGSHYDSTSTHHTEDSVGTISIDSADIIVDVDSTYGRPDTISNAQATMLKDLVKAASGGQKIKRVTIHISGLKKTSNTQTHIDSTHLVKSDTANVLKKDSTRQRTDTKTTVTEIHRTSYVIFGIFIFAAIAAFVILKFKLL